MLKNATVTLKRRNTSFKVVKSVNTTQYLPGQVMTEAELKRQMTDNLAIKSWIIT